MTQHTTGHLLFDQADTVNLAERFATPLFVFSQRRLEENIYGFLKPFQQAQTPFRVFYACKANSNQAILKIILERGLDIEVNSSGELYQAVKAGFLPEQIIFNGVAKSDDDLIRAIELGIYCINVDSISELKALASISKGLSARPRIALRIIPDIRDGGHPGLETGTNQSKFGLHPALIPEACKVLSEAKDNLVLAGIHAHIGSQLTSKDSFRKLIPQIVYFKDEIERLAPGHISHFNIGGGLPVNYLGPRGNTGISTPRHLKEFIRSFSPQDVAHIIKDLIPHGIKIFMEPGRSIVGDTAILLAKVIRKKEDPLGGPAWLILDTGFNILLESFSYQWYFHMASASRFNEPHTEGYLVGGPLCDAGDIFPIPHNKNAPYHRLLPPAIHEGEIIAFMDTGAYTLEQMSPYNGRLPAMAVMVTSDSIVKIIRKPYDYQDVMRYDLNL